MKVIIVLQEFSDGYIHLRNKNKGYAVQKFRPETEFFITIGEIQYTYNIIMLEDCDTNRIIAIAAQPFREDGRLDTVQINWYI